MCVVIAFLKPENIRDLDKSASCSYEFDVVNFDIGLIQQ